MDWNIQTRSRYCSVCQTKFVDKSPYQTTLYDRGSEGYWREDLCLECAQKEKNAEGAPEGAPGEEPRADARAGVKRGEFISQWQGVFQLPPPVAQDGVLRRDAIEILLRKVVELNDPHYVSAAYILAAMLERKRILKVKDVHQSEEKRKVTIYEQAKTGDIFAIEDPELHVHQLEEVQKEVCTLLEEGLPAEAEEALARKHSSWSGDKQESWVDDNGDLKLRG